MNVAERLAQGNLFESIPDDIDQEMFTELLAGQTVSVKRIVSKGHTSPESGWYDQEDNEWVIVLKGEGKIAFEDDSITHLVPGRYINIPAHTRHKVVWTSRRSETIWLAIHYN